jgi:hypothetical protein
VKLITLHDGMNPDQEVGLDADAITGVSPLGSGSGVECGGVMYDIHETPEQVEEIINEVEGEDADRVRDTGAGKTGAGGWRAVDQ